MTDMVERVARAMAKADGKDPDGPAWVRSPGAQPFGICWKDKYAGKACAAIEAMRGDVVPVFEDISNMDREWKQSRLTADMLNAGECAAWCNGGRPFGYNGVLNIWRAMIDAALNPPTGSK